VFIIIIVVIITDLLFCRHWAVVLLIGFWEALLHKLCLGMKYVNFYVLLFKLLDARCKSWQF